MAHDAKYSTLLAAFEIVCRNVRRVIDNHAGDDIRIDHQVGEVQQFFQGAQENREVFSADDWKSLDEALPWLLAGLHEARSEAPEASVEANEERTPVQMHRCLRIPEIVQLIVSHFDPDAGAKQLALLARTSRIFHDHALDILWSHQGQAARLFKCMPDDLWKCKIKHYRTVMSLRRPIATSDWDRFLHYSRRIKSFKVPALWREDLSKVYSALLQTDIPGRYLLPNLRSLSCGTPYEREYILPKHLALFLGPRLSGLQWNMNYTPLFTMVTERFPALKTVTLHPRFMLASDTEDTSPDEQSTSNFLRGLQAVECLETIHSDLPALLHLGTLTSLRTLKLYSLPTESLSSLHDQDLFPSLTSVQIHAPLARTESAADFIRLWTRPPVEFIVIVIPLPPTAPLLEGIFGALLEHCAPESLESLEVSLSFEPENGEILPGYVFESLTCFVNLVDLTIETTQGYDFDDAFMADLARAWPQIEVLQLRAEWHNHLPSVTIASLYTLAEQCRHLRELELTFDASSVPRPPAVTVEHLRTRKRPVRLHNNLTSLNVAHSPISDALAVARYLSIFYNLRCIHSDKRGWVEGELEAETEQDRVEMRYSRLWMKVQEYLPVLVDVREEEFEWGCRSIELVDEKSFEVL